MGVDCLPAFVPVLCCLSDYIIDAGPTPKHNWADFGSDMPSQQSFTGAYLWLVYYLPKWSSDLTGLQM